MRLRRLDPRSWPLRVKVPLVVAALMVVVGTVASQIVLFRLTTTQETYLRQLSSAYLDGLSTALVPHVARRDAWETFDVLDRSRERYVGLDVIHAVISLPDGRILAASDPYAFPVLSPAPTALDAGAHDGAELQIDTAAARAIVRRTLETGGGVIGNIYAQIDITALLAERRNVLLALVLLNCGVTFVLAAIGYIAVRRMLAPVGLLTEHVERMRDGAVVPIPTDRLRDPRTEFGRLFARFNAMAQALAEREALAARLAEEEKLAQLGRLASGMAHEVNNPLGGMQNVLGTLRKHGADPGVRETSLDLLERGLTSICNVVRAGLVTYKGGEHPERLTRSDLDDLRFLVQHEVSRRQLRLRWDNRLPADVAVDGGAVRQAVLNLLLNACAASPLRATVSLTARLHEGTLAVEIADGGPGLPADIAALLHDLQADRIPDRQGGLGVWAAARLVARLEGRFEIDTAPGKGTRIAILIPAVAEEMELDHVA
jgi:signal transduction histidine kinase